EQVGAVDLGPELLGLRDGAVGVVGEIGGDLDRHATVDVAGGLPDGAEDVECVADVLGRGLEDRLLGGGSSPSELGDLRIVRGVGGVGDGVREDRGVRGDPDDVARGDEIREVPGCDARTGEVVQPDAHARGGELFGGG
ncbi:hypothetical protein ABE10_02640, partial [Bacillus toyonensis]|nr:hypothetical protein [Bacillus toyonensis]